MTIPRKPLSELITLQRGFDLPAASRIEGDVPVVAATGIAGCHNEAKAMAPGVVIGRSGSIGGGQYIRRDFWPLNTTLWVKDFKGHNPRFVYYLLRSIDFTRFNAGAGVPTLNRNHLDSLQVPAFGVEAERRLSDLLGNYDDLIDNNRRRIALLDQSARLLYREWFVHLRFPGHEHVEILDGVPTGWRRAAIEEMFATTSGGTPSRANVTYFDGDINWVKTQELDELFIFDTEEHISDSALENSAAKLFPEGTLLVSIYGGSNIGRTGLLARPAASNQACVALMPKRKPDDVLFAQKWFQENRGYLVGLGQGAAQTNISQKTLKSQRILWPSDILLDEFTGLLRPMYDQIANLCQQNLRLAEARDLLLPRLMRGEIEV